MRTMSRLKEQESFKKDNVVWPRNTIYLHPQARYTVELKP